MQHQVADEALVFRIIKCHRGSGIFFKGKETDFVVISFARNGTIPLPVLGQTQHILPTLHQKQLIEIQQGIREQRVTLQADHLLKLTFANRIIRAQQPFGFGNLFFRNIKTRQELGRFCVLRRKTGRQILDSPT